MSARRKRQRGMPNYAPYLDWRQAVTSQKPMWDWSRDTPQPTTDPADEACTTGETDEAADYASNMPRLVEHHGQVHNLDDIVMETTWTHEKDIAATKLEADGYKITTKKPKGEYL